MPKKYTEEFKRDVVAMVRHGGATQRQIAKDFGVSKSALSAWLHKSELEERGLTGASPDGAAGESQALREALKRVRLLGAGGRGDAPCGGLLVAGNAPKMMYPLVRELAATGTRLRVPVVVACRVLGFSKQAYYKWVKRPVSARDWDEAHLINAAVDAHTDDPEFGYRLISDELTVLGFTTSERRVWRLCSQQQLWSVFSKKKPKTGRPGPAVHDDLVKRLFTADRANTLWLTDITEHKTAQGKLYLCAIKDVFSNRVVGYSIDSRMKARLAVDALEMAVAHRGRPTGVVVHSDRGSQFRSRKFVRALADHGLLGSMGKVAAAGDNAAMESFFALLQKNVLDRQSWASRDELRLAIVHWIERTYHRRRRQRRLGKLTPIEFETIMKDAVALAA